MDVSAAQWLRLATPMPKQEPRSRAWSPWRARLVKTHRLLGLAAALFWLVQAVTGTLIVFHWEVDDALLGQQTVPANPQAIQARLAVLAPPGSGAKIISVWASAGAANRYDVKIDDPQLGKQVVRIAGDGSVLRARRASERSTIDQIVALHQTLLLGDAGKWITGISGMLLLSNLLLGLATGWPGKIPWRRAIVPIRSGGLTARVYSWHRALGLIGAVPAMLLVGVGVSLAFEDGTARLVGAVPIDMPSHPGLSSIGFAAAVEAAERAIPGSTFTAVAAMPSAEDATYRIRLLAPHEWRRAYGTSIVYVDAANGRIRGAYPADTLPLANRFMNGLYAVHTGEISGVIGRLLVFSTGLWLASMTILGVMLWARKRRRPRKATI
ncbi:MAG: PepSY protein [Sphingomonas bacterium]|nr:PepSY protein [Sphingomonas bacterium]